MKGAERYVPDPANDPANTDQNDYATNQVATVIPWMRGERLVAVRWISPIYNQFTKPAPAERPGKKS